MADLEQGGAASPRAQQLIWTRGIGSEKAQVCPGLLSAASFWRGKCQDLPADVTFEGHFSE